MHHHALPVNRAEISLTRNVSSLDLGFAIIFTLPLIFHISGIAVSPYLQLFCATIVQVGAGRHFYKPSAQKDLLFTLGTSSLYVYSLVALTLHWNDLYFATSAIITTVVLIGQFLEKQVAQYAHSTVHILKTLSLPSALVERDGEYQEISIQEVRPGDHILVKAWQPIPVDGILLTGTSEVDESMITGASMPILKEVGDKVMGGTNNTSGVFTLIATTLGHESILFRLIRGIESAQSSQFSLQQWVDQVTIHFMPLVLFISLITFGVWALVGPSVQYAFLVSISVLLVASPSDFRLITPIAIVASMGTAAKKGILMKDTASLEALRKVYQVAFDKTGILTKGDFSLTYTEKFSAISEAQLLCLAASLQRKSEHPLSHAFLKTFKGKKFLSLKDFISFPGKGVTGTIHGATYYFGSEKLMTEHHIQIPLFFKASQTTLYLAKNGHLLALFRLTDRPRKRAPETLISLKNMGLKTVMLTGDNKETAQLLGNKLGVDDIFAQLQLKDKINYIKAQEYHHVHIGMVSNQLNDGPAFQAAIIGITMGSHSEVSLNGAPITLMRPSLELIPQAFALLNKTFRIIQENLVWAFTFNGAGIGLAAFGQLGPDIGGVAMAISSLIITLNSLRLKWI